MRLGGGPSLLDPFPEKPPRMHRLTYYRLSAKTMAAQERSIGLERDYLRRHYPAVLRDETVVGSWSRSRRSSVERGAELLR
jgi:hypothetical protein